MRIAYLILAHNNPNHLFRMIKRLSVEDVCFVVHLDKKMSKGDVFKIKSLLVNYSNVFFVEKRVSVCWGKMSIVDATLTSINYIIDHKINFDYVVLLSGSHYPIKTNKEIQSYFAENKGCSFFTYSVIPSKTRWLSINGGLDRIKYKPYLFGKDRNTLVETIKCLFLRAPRQKSVLEGFEMYGGSQWWSLPIEVVFYIYNFLKKDSTFCNFFRYKTYTPEEMFFQTLIMNSEYKDLVINNNLTYLSWPSPNAPSPKILDLSDFEKINESSALFARKFDENNSSDLPDSIDGTI